MLKHILLLCQLLLLNCHPSWLAADNQTSTLSPVLSQEDLPFTVSLEVADFELPNGLHSCATAVYNGKWLLLAGRTNGLHGFADDNNNFPAQQQNTTAYVVDIDHHLVWSRTLSDASGLSQTQIDLLSVTSPQFYQSGDTLYITGGYGVDSATGLFSTKNTLTAIDVPGFIDWVCSPSLRHLASQHVRTISNEAFRVTGGYMGQIGSDPTLLVFGQDFEGYYVDSSNGAYTNQVRRFIIMDDGRDLQVHIKEPKPSEPDPNYRRRDLNVVPVIQEKEGKLVKGLIAYAGVFTPTTGIWTVPVEITSRGVPSMRDPEDPETFKQPMNQYICATLGMYSRQSNEMYTLFFGGISFGYFENDEFKTDSEIPFINQITTIKRSQDGMQSQYLMDELYPTIASTQSNAGNTLLFGAGAAFFPHETKPFYSNGVLKFDKLCTSKQLVGYIVGGIQSTVPNTTSNSDTAASPYIFKVYIEKK